MTATLTILTLSVLLTAVQYLASIIATSRQTGIPYAAGPRDEPRSLTGMAGRLKRALDNQLEGLAFFTAAAIAAHLSQTESATTTTCAWIYLGARAAYVPAYLLGWTPWRSIIWFLGFGATVLIATIPLLSSL